MSEQNNNRTKWLHLRLKPEEYASDYFRKVLLDKLITATYRNKSLDDFMTEMMQLRNELNGIGNNFNQVEKKLHTLQQIAEFKAWLITYRLEKQTSLNKVDEIKNRINKMADQWLQ